MLALASLAAACTDANPIRIVEENVPVYDDKLKISGKVCTSDPSDVLFPLKVLFVIDTSQSMNVNDPIDPAEMDPLKQTGRAKAMLQVITKYIDLTTKFVPSYCSTGDPGCKKGETACLACGAAGTAMCIGPDCCSGTPCKGVPSCPAAPNTNGTCAPLCDVKKPGCLPGEKACLDCPNAGDQCMGGVCGKHLDPGVEFALMRFGSAKQVLTKNRDGIEGFTNDIKELVTSLPQLNNGGSVTDYEGALTTAFTVLSRDMADMQKKNLAAVARSKYVVIFLSDGQPDPKVNDEDDWKGIPSDLQKDLLGPGLDPSAVTEYNVDARILRRVKEIMGLKTIYRVGDIRVHTAYLAGQNPSWLQDQATFLLKQMSQVGQGTFRNFQNGEDINFLHVDFSSLKRVYRMKNLIVSNLSARPVAGGLQNDSDADGIDDATERAAGTNPAKLDTDGDGFSDTVEHFFRTSGWDALNPLDADCSMVANDLDGDKIPDDSDGDGLADCEERFLGTSKDLFDTDADGIPDGIEVRFGTNPTVIDVEDDLDFDGMPNGDEIRLHTDPRADDASHRSRASYRYNVRQVGTGIETVARRCKLDADCPTKADCRDGYCRCVQDDGCSSKAACKTDTDCLVGGETCVASVCTGKWKCQAAIPGTSDSSNLCAAKKNISCYEFEVENITLVTPRSSLVGLEDGWNTVGLYFGEVPFDNPGDYGNFSSACVRAWYYGANGAKLPATGRVEIPEQAWYDPSQASKTYLATSTDSKGGRSIPCGKDGTGAQLYCNGGDACANAAVARCQLVNCVCPDGTIGACSPPPKQ